MKIETLAKWLITMWISITLLAIGLAAFARAEGDGDWLPRRWKKERPYHYYPRPQRRNTERYYFNPPIEDRCLGRIIPGTGQEASSEEGALKSAERSWGALVRYDHAEKFMDLKYAEHYASRCQRSSTGESTTAKVMENITGGSVGVLYRCRIWAEPCTAPKTQDGGREH